MKCAVIRKEKNMRLNENELMKIAGGGYGVAATIGAAIAFLISMIDGFLNPIQCLK